MMNLKYKIICIYLCLLGSTLYPFFVFANLPVNLEGQSLLPTSKIYLNSYNKDIQVGSNFDVPIYINTNGYTVNTIRLELKFDPSKLSVVKYSGNQSIFGIWFESPFYDNKSGVATFSGIIPDGINTKSGLITTLTFNAKSIGRTKIYPTEYSSVNLNDGFGSNVILNIAGSYFNLTNISNELTSKEEILIPLEDTNTNLIEKNPPITISKEDSNIKDIIYLRINILNIMLYVLIILVYLSLILILKKINKNPYK